MLRLCDLTPHTPFIPNARLRCQVYILAKTPYAFGDALLLSINQLNPAIQRLANQPANKQTT